MYVVYCSCRFYVADFPASHWTNFFNTSLMPFNLANRFRLFCQFLLMSYLVIYLLWSLSVSAGNREIQKCQLSCIISIILSVHMLFDFELRSGH